MFSTFFMYRNAYTPITGHPLSADDDQDVWDHFRHRVEGLQLPDQSALPETYAEVHTYYDRVVREKCQSNVTLDGVVHGLRHPAMPEVLPTIAKPAWLVVSPLLGHVAGVLSFGIIHPGISGHARVKWSRRKDIEFAALCRLLRIAYYKAPAKLTYSPLAYNRLRYERLVAAYRSKGLESFLPDDATAGYPI